VSEEDDDERTAPILQVVDFNALNAALGELPSSPPSSPPLSGDSDGAKKAKYASSHPRPLPQRVQPSLDANAPAVIVKTDDTVPSGPPIQMTTPMVGAPPVGSRGRPAHAAEAYSVDDDEPTVTNLRRSTRPKRPRNPTMIVHRRGPTAFQKFAVFLAMLLVFVSGGAAFLVFGGYGSAIGIDIDRLLPASGAPHSSAPAVTAPPTVVATPVIFPTTAASSLPDTPAAAVSSLPSASAAAALAPSASAKKPKRQLPFP
jgi:hypothetical protein